MARRENVAHCADDEVRPKENPDTLPMVGVSVLRRSTALRHSAANCSELLAVRPVIEDQKADEEHDGKAPSQKIEVHRGDLVTAFNFLDDDGADQQGNRKASGQKIKVHRSHLR